MKVIFVNRFFYPDHSATSQMLGGIAFGLAARGHAVTVITSRLGYENTGQELPVRETINGVDIVRVASSRRGRYSLAGRSLDYATFYVAAARALSKLTGEGDIIVAKTDPPLLSIAAASIARRRKARLVNWLQDIFPETAERLGFGTSAVAKVGVGALTRMRDASLLAADINVVLGDRMRAFVEGRGVQKPSVRVIPNWADGRLITPVPAATNALRDEWGLQSSFVVGYSGNLGRAHDIETMLRAIEETEASSAAAPLEAMGGSLSVKWLIIGSWSLNEAMRHEVAQRGLKSVVFKPYQPASVLAQSLSAADAHIVSLRPALEGLIVPSKFYGIIAAGRPVLFIGAADGEVGSIVRAEDIGRVVEEGDAAALAGAVMSLASHRLECDAQGRRARALFEKSYDHSTAIETWHTMIGELGSAPATGPSQA